MYQLLLVGMIILIIILFWNKDRRKQFSITLLSYLTVTELLIVSNLVTWSRYEKPSLIAIPICFCILGFTTESLVHSH